MNNWGKIFMNAIEVKDITKKYDNFRLNHVSLQISEGSIYGLIGENGAGKTTLINCILGLVQPNYGDVEVLGSNNFINEVELKDQLGFVINDMGIPNILTVDKIEEVFSKIYKHWDHEQFVKLLKQFEIDKDEKYETLSLGNKMRIAIAIALSHNAKLLVLDEPMNALDPAIRAEVVDLLIEYTRQEDHTILISSHIVTDLEKMCDYIGFMHAGELIFQKAQLSQRKRHHTK